MEATDLVMGDRYRDRISGWQGVLTGRYEYLNGCVRVELSGSAEGKPEGYIFDVQQVETAHERPNAEALPPPPVATVPTVDLLEAVRPSRPRRFWRWLWDTDNSPAPRMATGGPRPTPPRTGSR